MKFSVTIFWLLLLTVTFVSVSSKRKYHLLNYYTNAILTLLLTVPTLLHLSEVCLQDAENSGGLEEMMKLIIIIFV